jgi:hypothetical protein
MLNENLKPINIYCGREIRSVRYCRAQKPFESGVLFLLSAVSHSSLKRSLNANDLLVIAVAIPARRMVVVGRSKSQPPLARTAPLSTGLGTTFAEFT